MANVKTTPFEGYKVGEYYPHPDHAERIKRYKRNRRLFLGKHGDVFDKVQARLSARHKELVYIAVNFPGIICKRSADLLFGEAPVYLAGKPNSPEQQRIEELVRDNRLNMINYEMALGAAYRGDSFYKIRWGQRWGGLLPEDIDPFRPIIESQNPMYVFPQTAPGDVNKIIAYHIAYPLEVEGSLGREWILFVEEHHPGRIVYRQFRMNPTHINAIDNEYEEWKIYAEITDAHEEVETGVPFPLVVHVPNFATDDSWEGIDDLSEHESLFDEINNRLSQISVILDKHADPAIAVPAGTLEVDEQGNPIFRVAEHKVFEVDGKEDIIPEYITWDGQLEAAFKELEKLVEFLLMTSEIPMVALGKDNAGTSGASGLSIKWRLNPLLAKINRKRQYFNEALMQTLYIAQLLEHAQAKKKPDYTPTVPKIVFKDGLPDDELEMANIMSIRTGGKPTMSQKRAIMLLDGMTEEQAEAEMRQIEEEQKREMAVSSSIFNEEVEKEMGEGGDD